MEYPDYIADILNAGECLINSGLNEPDPAFDVCPNLKVKIIDLGNACWIVSWCVLLVKILFNLRGASCALSYRTNTLPRTFKLDNTGAQKWLSALHTGPRSTVGQ